MEEGTYFSMGLDIEYRFSTYIGLMIGGSLDSNMADESTYTYGKPLYVMSGHTLKAGIPIYFNRRNKSWFLALEGGIIEHTYEDKSLNTETAPNLDFQQVRYGATLGKTMIKDCFEWRLSYYSYEQKAEAASRGLFSFGIGFHTVLSLISIL